MSETPTEATEPEAEEVPEEIDDTVPCPACHQPTRLSLLEDNYAAEVPAKYRPKAKKEKG